MKRIDNKKSLIISIALFIALIIGIGYAYLTSNLSISGQTEIAGNTWDIHFENLKVNTFKSIIPNSAPVIDDTKTSINYSLTLEYPGDTYEFTVDVKNAGTLPGEVSISEILGINEDAAKLVDYTIKYTKDNKPVSVGDILYSGAKKNITVTLSYKEDIDETDFLDSNINLNITYSLQYIQSQTEYTTLGEILVAQYNDYFDKYTGTVTDELNKTVDASKVYYPNNKDKYHFKLGGYCWQVLRTTETGGVKLQYRGVEHNGTCMISNEDHVKTLSSSYGTTDSLSQATVYGNSFEYDLETATFTLKDTFNSTWSEENFPDLQFKFTCRSDSDTCATLFYIGNYESEYYGRGTQIYTTNSYGYMSLTSSCMNGFRNAMSSVGFMFNKLYSIKDKNPGTNEYKYGNTFIYDENTNTYTLSGTTQSFNSWSTAYNQLTHTHYTCWNNTGTCSSISYIFNTSSSSASYIDLVNGKGVDDALDDMLYGDDVNQHDSTMKIVLDQWYKNYFTDFTKYLEDVVYCNNRTIVDRNGWNPDKNPYQAGEILFEGNNNMYKGLSCPNITDQFAVGNNKAKLTYPVGISTLGELNAVSSDLYNTTILSMTPNSYSGTGLISGTCSSGSYCRFTTDASWNMRPVISLAPSNRLTGGEGTADNPWTID